ncbi:MAG: prolyl oligopeptidase family serine peptidase [Planctomycetes bacterium]|nr:prolyl oligopeptidase family serine peptidase [Planctomycetota bacterium]
MQKRLLSLRVFVLLATLAFCPAWVRAEAPADAPRTDELAVRPGVRGVLTHWLTAPAVPDAVEKLADAPSKARAGTAAPGGGKWGYTVSEGEFVELKDQIRGVRNGSVWAIARVKSPTGGARVLTAYAFGAIKVFIDGKAVLAKPAAAGDRSDSVHANIELPKGECEIALATGIRWGYCNFAVVLTDAKLRPVPEDLEIIQLEEGRSADAGSALARSLSLASDFAFVTEGQVCGLTLSMIGGWPADAGEFRVRYMGPDGKEWAAPGGKQLPLTLASKPLRASFKGPAQAGAEVKLTCELLAEKDEKTSVLGTKTLRLYTLAGIKSEYAKLQEEIVKVRAQAGKPLPVAALALEKTGIWLERLASGDERPSEALGATLVELLQTAREDMPVEAAGKDPFENKPGYLERAYWSVIDESAQPYFAYVPSAAKDELSKPRDQAKKFPLVVFLHGYVPDYHKHRWWGEMPEFNAVFERQGAFLCIPFGRSNADFVGIGEVDVLKVMEEMKRLYPIDEERVYLYGYSMGGMGAYTICAHYPEPWAAAIAIAGRADSPLLMKTQGLGSLQPFKQWLVRADQPIDLCENFVNIPIRIYHGTEDQFISPDEAKRMEKRLKEIGCDAKLTTMPGNHWFGFDLMADDELVKWLLTHTREKSPKVQRLKNYSLRFGSLFEAQLRHVTGQLEAFDFQWERDADGVKLKKLKGPVVQLAIKGCLGGLPNDLEGYSCSSWKGEDGQWALFRLKSKAVGPEILGLFPEWKTSVRCGPVKEATYGPFLIVYGTTGGADALKRNKAAAESFAEAWYDFAKGKAQIKADKDVTEEEKKTKNLFLFGEEQENKLHAECAATKKLPFEVKDGKAAIGEKTFELKDRGIMYIYPSPFEGAGPERSVVICAGLLYGKHLPFNHKLDLVPDFLIYTADPDNDGTNTNKPVVAGYFDGKWKLSADTTWYFDK